MNSLGQSAGLARSRARMSEHESSVVVRMGMSNKLGLWGGVIRNPIVGDGVCCIRICDFRNVLLITIKIFRKCLLPLSSKLKMPTQTLSRACAMHRIPPVDGS